MKFVITKKGLIPEKHKDTFDPFWGELIFHDFAEHFYEGEGIFVNDCFENILGEICAVGSTYYMDVRLRLKMKTFKSKLNIITDLTGVIFNIIDDAKWRLLKYKNNSEFIRNIYDLDLGEKINAELSTLSKCIWDKHLTYNKKNHYLFSEDYQTLIYKSLKLGYKLCKDKFENYKLKEVYNFNESLKRLKNKDPNWFYNNFKRAEIVTIKKGQIKLKFYK